MRLAAVVLACGSLLGGGFVASFAGADNPPVPAPTTAASVGSVPGDFVTNLVVTCNRAHWRVSFTLALSALVSGRFDLRQHSGQWTLVRVLYPRQLSTGPHLLELGPRPSGVYRVRLTFRAAARARVLHTLVFRAGCRQRTPTTTLPTGPGRA